MRQTKNYNVSLPIIVANVVDRLADELEISGPAVIRRAIGVLDAFEKERKAGVFIGATRNREALDTIFVAPL